MEGKIEGLEENSKKMYAALHTSPSNISFNDFMQSIKDASETFKHISKSETIRLISHLDADGISAAAIMIKTLNRLNRKYALSIVQQLDEKTIREIAQESYTTFVFTDIGSGQISLIIKHLAGKRIFVLDHHEIEKLHISDSKVSNIIHINPHIFGIDGSTEVSGAGVVFLFAREVDPKNEDIAHIALLGAIGDIQDNGNNGGFSEINKMIIGIAVKKGKIKVEKGLKFFGIQTKPIYKLLEQNTDFLIPGVTGSESGAIQFLQSIGINPKNGKGEWKKLPQLSDEEMKKLVTGIILMRLNEKEPENVIGDIYTLSEEQEESPLRDAREFSTLLNACGRIGRASFGIGACLGDKRAKQSALNTLADYKKEIMKALCWFEENMQNKNSEHIIKGKGFVIINAEDKVLATIIGTLASIISKSSVFPEGTIIVSMARMLDGKTKVSSRISGKKEYEAKTKIDTRELMAKIASIVGGEAGGHRSAAGAVIATEKEKDFISATKNFLNAFSIEEKIQ